MIDQVEYHLMEGLVWKRVSGEWCVCVCVCGVRREWLHCGKWGVRGE
jgi:hypothetical protein